MKANPLLVQIAAIALLGTFSPIVQAHESTQPVNVVLVHGFLNTGKIFNPLITQLEKEGCRCFAPSLSPNNCKNGVHDLAAKLSAQIDQHFGRKQSITMIGFSMGGVITRDYVQNFADRKRISCAFLISAPNHGTFWACLSPGGGIRDLAIGSPFLNNLNAGEVAWKDIPVSSYWSPYDLMILPARSSLWPVGETKRIRCPLHPLMAKNREVMADIATKIKGMRNDKSH